MAVVPRGLTEHLVANELNPVVLASQGSPLNVELYVVCTAAYPLDGTTQIATAA
jgi:hypothetical protein